MYLNAGYLRRQVNIRMFSKASIFNNNKRYKNRTGNAQFNSSEFERVLKNEGIGNRIDH
jgi:hypothetical protein